MANFKGLYSNVHAHIRDLKHFYAKTQCMSSHGFATQKKIRKKNHNSFEHIIVMAKLRFVVP